MNTVSAVLQVQLWELLNAYVYLPHIEFNIYFLNAKWHCSNPKLSKIMNIFISIIFKIIIFSENCSKLYRLTIFFKKL